jgi:quercetin dioxygenase-like cupin family protein
MDSTRRWGAVRARDPSKFKMRDPEPDVIKLGLSITDNLRAMPIYPEFTNAGQPSNLRPVQRHITTHDLTTGLAIVHSSEPATWKNYDDNLMGFNLVYSTTSFPATLSNDEDIKSFERINSEYKVGLVQPNGTVLRMVDFAPGYESMMHRTQSLDYGIVLEGEIEMKLDSGDVKLLRRGDVAIQRGTNHSWRNTSKTDWARMIYVLQYCHPVEVGGHSLREDLGRGVEGLPASGA